MSSTKNKLPYLLGALAMLILAVASVATARTVHAQVAPQADVSVTKSDSPDPVTQGQPLTYTVVVTNNGPDAAANVILSDTLPAGVTFNFATITQGTCGIAFPLLQCQLGAMNSGATVTLTIRMTPNTAGSITNSVSVTTDTSDPDSGNNSASQSTTVNALQADVSVTKSDSPDPVTQGQPLTYTVVVTNNGPDAAANVILSDTLPAGVTFNFATITQGSCAIAFPLLQCQLGVVNSGATVTLTIRMTPNAGGTITNSVSVTTDTNDPDSSNNSASQSTTVNALQADVSVTKSDSPDPVLQGQPLNYVVVVTNNGPDAAANVILTDTLPAGVTFNFATITQGTCGIAFPLLQCQLGAMNSGATVTLTIRMTPNTEGVITNSVSVTTDTSDPDSGNNSASQSTTVNAPQADVSVTKSDSPDPVLQGQPLTYVVVVTNDGPDAAANVVLSDILPTGVSFNFATITQGTCAIAFPLLQCQLGAMNSGATVTLTIRVTPNTDDTITNSVSVTTDTNDPDSDNNSASQSTIVTALQNPSISLTKSASPASYSAVNEVINYTLAATNDGDVTLTDVSISDPTVGALTCAPAQPATLAPGASLTCTGSHTVTQADLDAGSISNTASATGAPTAYVATLSGAAESPPNASPGVGNAIIDLDTPTHTMRVRVVFSGLTGATTAAHIHTATAAPGSGTAGVATQVPTFAGFPLGVTNGSYDHTFDLTLASSWNPAFITAHGGAPAGAEAFFAASLAAGKAYLNVHSTFSPGGEIRGFLSSGPALSATASATVTAVQTPALSLTKSADPTIYSYPGQVIVYTYVVENTGNVTLSGPFNIADDRLGTFQCGTATSLAPGGSITCTNSYTIQASDLNATNNASITNHATATGEFGNNTVTSNQAQATIHQAAPTARIAPTDTTCQQFANGAAGNLTDEFYDVKSGKISNVSPGVFFYYSKITAPASSFMIQVKQSDILGWKKIGTMQLILWNASCAKTFVTGVFDSTSGTVTFNASGLTAGATYYISVKYKPNTLVGQAAPGDPTDVYTFVTYINGNQIIPSWDSVNIKPR